MRVYLSLESVTKEDFPSGTAIAIGKFDGVHLGHQVILSKLGMAAEARGLDAVAFTFANNPLTYLRPELCPSPLMSKSQRLAAIEATGVTACVMVEFDEALAQTSAEDYVEQILVSKLCARYIIVGADFRFGHRGSGDIDLLTKMSALHGFELEVVGSVDDPDLGRISSTAVRHAIEAGDATLASRMLGRPFLVEGEVVHGEARGRDLGFPTANLGGAIEGLVPAHGVYAGWVIAEDARHPAAISVGTNPTFTTDGQSRVEAYLLDFSGDLYGQRIQVQFIHHLRDMVAYTGADDLVAQMHEDVARTRELLDV